MLLIALSATFSYGIVWDQIPQKMAEFMLGISDTPWVVMLIIIGFLLFAGTAHGLDGVNPDVDLDSWLRSLSKSTSIWCTLGSSWC